MILDPLELCWTEVSNFQEGPVQTFCGLYGGIRGHLGPKMGPQIGPKGPPRELKIHSKIRLSSQSKYRPVKSRFGAQVGGPKTHKSLIGVLKFKLFPHIF